ncbi:MAG TPA: HAD family hydrolase [Terriglobales bacterium]|jgi:sugar-phosphatase|nr:HAD family hydrolase [Terriglobales bacterium]
MQTFSCLAILFDLDGVLMDSTGSVTRQWSLWAREQNIDPQVVVEIAHGVRTIEVVRRLAPHLDAEAEVKRLEKREADDQEGVSVMPGAADLLKSIPQGRWCVVTSGTRYLATARLRLGQLPIPEVLVSADDVSRGKPDPQPYLMGAKLLGMNPAECLVIEDAPAGIRAAHAGGMKAIAITSTYPAPALAEAEAVVQRLAQIRVDPVNGARGLTVSLE